VEVLKEKHAVVQAFFFVRERERRPPRLFISSHPECIPVQLDPISSNEGLALGLVTTIRAMARFETELKVPIGSQGIQSPLRHRIKPARGSNRPV